MNSAAFALCFVALAAASGPTNVIVNAGEGKDSTISLQTSGKSVVFHSKDNAFSVTANGNQVLSMSPLATDSAAFTPQVIGAFQIDKLTVGAIYSQDFEVVNPDLPLQQWLGVFNDEFGNSSQGWLQESGVDLQTSTCGGVTMIGGSCQTSHHVISKSYQLPKHAQVQITARFHFLDNWDDDTAYLRIVDKIGNLRTLWAEQYTWCPQFFTMMCARGNSLCGKEEYPDKLSRLISVSLDHTDPVLNLQFGTNIPTAVPPCEVSYGVSSIVVEVR